MPLSCNALKMSGTRGLMLYVCPYRNKKQSNCIKTNLLIVNSFLIFVTPPTLMTSSKPDSKAPFDLWSWTLNPSGFAVVAPSAWYSSQNGAPTNSGSSLVLRKPATAIGQPLRWNSLPLVGQLCSWWFNFFNRLICVFCFFPKFGTCGWTLLHASLFDAGGRFWRCLYLLRERYLNVLSCIVF